MNFVDYLLLFWFVVLVLIVFLFVIVIRCVLILLSLGIIVGVLMLFDGNVFDVVLYLKNSVVFLFYKGGEEGFNSNNINIILFLILLGILMFLLSVFGVN